MRKASPKKQITMSTKEFREKHIGVKEDDIQQAIILELSRIGFIVMQTTHRTRSVTCEKCGNKMWGRSDYGATRGVPDLLVRHLTWPPTLWAGIEVKGPNTKASPEQLALLQEKHIAIVRSVDEALKFVYELHNSVFRMH